MLIRTALAATMLAPLTLSAQQAAIASWVAFDAPVGLEMRPTPVPYTHLTLPTKRTLDNSVDEVS